MDSIGLVEGGVEGLGRIAVAFRSAGIPVTAVYLIKFTTDDDEDRWVLRLIVEKTTPIWTGGCSLSSWPCNVIALCP